MVWAQWDSWGIKESRAMFICLEHPKWLNNVNVTDRGDKHRTAQLFVFYGLVHIIKMLSLKRKYQFPRVTALMMLWLMAWFDPTRPRNPTFSHTISQVVNLSTPEFYLLGEGVKNVFTESVRGNPLQVQSVGKYKRENENITISRTMPAPEESQCSFGTRLPNKESLDHCNSIWSITILWICKCTKQ